jgi:hypothetical protein
MAQGQALLKAQPTARVSRHTIWLNSPVSLDQPGFAKSYTDTWQTIQPHRHAAPSEAGADKLKLCRNEAFTQGVGLLQTWKR